MFEKRNLFSKLWLKIANNNQYRQYKWELRNYTEQEALNFFRGENRLDTQEKIVEVAKKEGLINITHSGNSGDLIYALPTIKKIYEITGVPINLYLRLNRQLSYTWSKTQTVGAAMISPNMAEMLFPLLNSQPYINKTGAYNNQIIHVDLDFFRSKTISLNNSNLARWYSYVTGFTPELWKPWIKIDPDFSYADTIILARSERYRNSTISYSFLKNYKNTAFIGIKSEYEDMKKVIPDLQWIQLNNFLELAQMIAGCKFFIGNQSFPYSIAEGLKSPRIMEAYYHLAHVIPEGENAHDFYYQNHFASLVRQLNEKN